MQAHGNSSSAEFRLKARQLVLIGKIKMAETPRDSARARAEALFHRVTPEQQQSATEEYRAKQQAELDKTARLRALRNPQATEERSEVGLKRDLRRRL